MLSYRLLVVNCETVVYPQISQISADAYVLNVSKPLINTNGHGCRGAAVTGNE